MSDDSEHPVSSDLLDFVRNIDFFRLFDEPFQQELAANLEEVLLAEGEYLFHQGDPGDDGLYIVIEGRLNVLVTDPRGETVIEEQGPGAVVGEIGMLTGGTRTATIQAVSATELLKISKATFDQLCQENPQILPQAAQIVSQRLRHSQLFSVLPNLLGPLDLPTFNDVEAELSWLHLARGERLIQQGALDDNLYVLVSGRLQAMVTDEAGNEQVVGEIVAGESVGEMQLLTGETRSATVYSVRDSDLVKLSKAGFDRLVTKYPQMMRRIAQLVIKRLQRTLQVSAVSSSNLALDIVVVPISSTVSLVDFTQRLARNLEKLGTTLILDQERFESYLGIPDAAQTTADDPHEMRLMAWLNEQATHYTFRLFVTDWTLTPWTKRCLRQADRIILVGQAGPDPTPSAIEIELQDLMRQSRGVHQTLVLLHPDGKRNPTNTQRWLAFRRVEEHHHVRLDNDADFGRLARFVAGQAIGLVLGGGAARGLAHIGVIQALQEAHIPIDLIGGNSSGAIIAAFYTLGWSPKTMQDRILRHMRNPLIMLDPTLPVMSVFKGHRQVDLLKQILGEVKIEDLWINFFCVASNLTRANLVVHQAGPLWRAVLSSNTLPGITPPIVQDGDLLGDGAFLNNFPIDIMRQRCGSGGTVIGVDVTPPIDMANNPDFGDSVSGFHLLCNNLIPSDSKASVPNVPTLLWRAAELGSIRDRREQLKQELVDFYLRPPVERFAMTDRAAVREIAQVGYEYAKQALSSVEIAQLKNF